MTDSNTTVIRGVLVEEEVHFTLLELSRACRADSAWLVALVEEGVLSPTGADPQQWRFSDTSLRRARAAQRLARDMELSAAGTALVLDLLDEIEALRARLRRAGITD